VDEDFLALIFGVPTISYEGPFVVFCPLRLWVALISFSPDIEELKQTVSLSIRRGLTVVVNNRICIPMKLHDRYRGVGGIDV